MNPNPFQNVILIIELKSGVVFIKSDGLRPFKSLFGGNKNNAHLKML